MYVNIDMICPFRTKIKFYLFGIAARPTEKLAAQIIMSPLRTKEDILF